MTDDKPRKKRPSRQKKSCDDAAQMDDDVQHRPDGGRIFHRVRIDAMTTQTTYTCDGCGKQKRGVPEAGQEYGFRDGQDAIAEDWSDLRLQDFGHPIRAYFRHYCPGCTRCIVEIINNPLPQ